MTDDELVEKCLLTMQEYSLAIIDYMRQHGGVTPTANLTEKEKFEITCKAQVLKDIPIIQKAERE